jgi:uncharacterized membrane protein
MQKKIDATFRWLIFIFYFGIFFLAFYAPVLQELKGYPAGEGIYSLFSPICHQYPTRSFWIFERPWALCARCSSAYLGVALAALFIKPALPFYKRSLIGAILVALAAIDPTLQLFGFYESINTIRLITGLLGGIGGFLLLYPIPFKYKEQQ